MSPRCGRPPWLDRLLTGRRGQLSAAAQRFLTRQWSATFPPHALLPSRRASRAARRRRRARQPRGALHVRGRCAGPREAPSRRGRAAAQRPTRWRPWCAGLTRAAADRRARSGHRAWPEAPPRSAAGWCSRSTAWTAFCRVDPDRMLAWVQPGVVNLELSRRLAERGLYYAPDPASQQVSTIGGNVATNAGGPALPQVRRHAQPRAGHRSPCSTTASVVTLGGEAPDAPDFDLAADRDRQRGHARASSPRSACGCCRGLRR